MPAWFDHLFFLILVVLFPLRAARSGIGRLRRAQPAEVPRVRVAVYREAILIQWSLAAVLAALWILTGRAWSAVGVTLHANIGLAVMAGLTAAAIVFTIYQRRRALASDDALLEVRERMAHLAVMLPHQPRELGLFYRLSATAGVCEELLYRGYLIWYLAHWMPLIAAAAAASAIFGFGHAYQGRRGIVTTGLFGAALATVYLISGSLWLPMLLHLLVDVHSGHLAFHAFRRGAELDRRRYEREAEERAAARAAAEHPAVGAATDAGSSFDVAIIGLGAMGSAIAYHLAARGVRVIGFDRWRPPHEQGSSHGETRLIREAYFEDPFYVPIVQRAYQLWTALEAEAGTPLLRLTGGLMIGTPGGALVTGAERSASVHRLPYEHLSAAALRERWPGIEPGDDRVAVWEPRTGMLFPEACVATHLSGAALRGAALRFDEPVAGWRAAGAGVEIETAAGRFRAARLVLAGGAWMPGLLGGAAVPLRISRQTLHWFEPAAAPERFDPERFPAWIYEHAQGLYSYGFPRLHGTVKTAMHVPGATVDPDALAREASAEEIGAMTDALARYAPDIPGRRVKSAVCMYTNTPDMHFAIDRHPGDARVLIVSACSGHGFKFSSAIGEAVADLAMDRTPRFDLAPFRIARFGSGEALAPVR